MESLFQRQVVAFLHTSFYPSDPMEPRLGAQVDSAAEVLFVEEMIRKYALPASRLRLLGSIESPLAVMNLRDVSSVHLSKGAFLI